MWIAYLDDRQLDCSACLLACSTVESNQANRWRCPKRTHAKAGVVWEYSAGEARVSRVVSEMSM